MLNFISINPASDNTGCAHFAKADKHMFENFRHDWFTLSCKKDCSKNLDFQRTAPTNGLLLNTFHDSLFDKGFITVLPDYTIKISEILKKRSDINSEFSRRWIFGIENTQINLPPRFRPDKQCLEWHNKYKFME